MSFPNPRLTPTSAKPGSLVGDFVFFDDFFDCGYVLDANLSNETDPGAKFSINANASQWLLTATNDGTIVCADGEPGGVLHITTDTGDDDSYEFQCNGEGFEVAAGKDIYFEIRMKLTAAVAPLTTIDWFVGLATTDTAVLDGTTEAIGFRTGAVDAVPLNAGGASITASVGNTMAGSWTATTIDEADTGVDYVDNTFLVLAFHVISNTRVDFYVDGSLKYTATTLANIPTGDAVTPTICIQNNAGAAKQMLIDYIYCAQVR